jgi:tetratricopeptide (TPR) repeat protein
VVHLAGDMTGSTPGEHDLKAFRSNYPDLEAKLPPLAEALESGTDISYTHWEAWLALYNGKRLFIVKPTDGAERGPKYQATDASRAAQAGHLARLKAMERYPGEPFTSPDNLSKQILASAILDLLVKAEVLAYAEEQGRRSRVAEGFIEEMAEKVAGDRELDREGKKQAVRNAIEIYLREIAGGQSATNYGAIVNEALKRARSLVDEGKSGLARATLRKASDTLRREEAERRELYVAGVTALYNRERDIALAAYDGEGAADAILALGEAVHGENAARVGEFLKLEANTLFELGRDRGSNVHLAASIALRRKLLGLALSVEERGAELNNLGNAQQTLGRREGGTARLDESVATYREALRQCTRKRAPLDWAKTHNNLGVALRMLGEREGGSVLLDEAVTAFREALKEWTRDRAPLDWAGAQNNLGNALGILGTRQSGTTRLDEAVVAYREALKEWSRERVPLLWATTQNNLGNALQTLGSRESGTVRLEEAVTAYREALKERTRERVPLDWAMTQNNLGSALWALGSRETVTARIEEAVTAYREALKERTRERMPLDWAKTQNNLGAALKTLGEYEGGTARLHEAVAAYRDALHERTRDRVPLDWAQTQMNLGNALAELAKRQRSRTVLEEALGCMRSAVEAYQHAGESYWLPKARSRATAIQAELEDLKR